MGGRRRRHARKGWAAGATLVEAMVAILMTAVITLAVFSVALTAKRLGSKTERKVAAAYAARMLSDRLKNYVAMAPLDPLHASLGPNRGAAETWSLPGGSGYALAEIGTQPFECPPEGGAHDMTGLLPAYLRAEPYNMTMVYQVSDPNFNVGEPNYRPTVNVCVQWSEPP